MFNKLVALTFAFLGGVALMKEEYGLMMIIIVCALISLKGWFLDERSVR